MGDNMKKVYLDTTKFNNCPGVLVKEADVVWAGASVNAMSINLKNNEYDRFAREYDIHFVFKDNIPLIDFYTVPMVEIFAVDSLGGYFVSVGGSTDFQKKIPICYIDVNKNSYLIAENGKSFLNKVHEWKNNLIPYKEIEFFNSLKEAQEKYDFLDTSKLNNNM